MRRISKTDLRLAVDLLRVSLPESTSKRLAEAASCLQSYRPGSVPGFFGDGEVKLAAWRVVAILRRARVAIDRLEAAVERSDLFIDEETPS